jgi:hypothetical protein
MNVDHVDTYLAGTFVSFKRLEFAKLLDTEVFGDSDGHSDSDSDSDSHPDGDSDRVVGSGVLSGGERCDGDSEASGGSAFKVRGQSH